MSLLTICQNSAVEIGISVPPAVVGNLNLEAVELYRFAQKEGEQVVKRADWRMLRKELLYTTLAQEEQTNFFPSDCDHFVNNTLWNRTRKLPLFGPVTPQEWQNIKAWTSSPIQNTLYIRGSSGLLSPAPAAGETIAGEYISKNFCQSSGGTPQSSWQADTDTGIIDERLMTLGVIVRFKIAKGLDASAAMAEYETMIQQYILQDKPARTISLADDEPYGGRRPGVVVPEGYWNL